MNSYTNKGIRLAALLTSTLAFGGLFIAAPVAHASYGANTAPSLASQVCSSRFDPNCIVEETNYLNEHAVQPVYNNYNTYGYQAPTYQYNQPQQQYYNYTPTYYNYTPTYYTPQYSYSNPSQYNYSYQTPSYQYNYQYEYEQPEQPFVNYEQPQYNNNYSSDCYDSYDCSY